MSKMEKYVNATTTDFSNAESYTFSQYITTNAIENTTNLSMEYTTSGIAPSRLMPSDIALLTIAVVGIIGNFTVIIVILNYPRARKKLANLFIINQSFIDLTASTLLLSSHTYAVTVSSELLLSPHNVGDQILCRVWITNAPLWSLFMSSGYGILLLSLERYVAIVHPLFHITCFTVPQAAIAMATTWLIGLLFNFLALIPTSDITNGTCHIFGLMQSDQDTMILGMLTFVIEYVIPVIALLFLYGRMAYVLHHRLNTFKKTGNSANGQNSSGCYNCKKLSCWKCICSLLCGLVRCHKSCCTQATDQIQIESNFSDPHLLRVKNSISTTCESSSELPCFSILKGMHSECGLSHCCAMESVCMYSVPMETDSKNPVNVNTENKNPDKTAACTQSIIEMDSQCQRIPVIDTPHSMKISCTMKTDELILQSLDMVSKNQNIVATATVNKQESNKIISGNIQQNFVKNVTKKCFSDNRTKSAYVCQQRTVCNSSSSAECEIITKVTDTRKTVYDNAHYNVIKTMVTIAVSFITCWTLNEVVYVLERANVLISSALYNTSVFLVCMHCCINPLIYAIQYRDFKTGVVILLRRLSGKSAENSRHQSDLRRAMTISSFRAETM